MEARRLLAIDLQTLTEVDGTAIYGAVGGDTSGLSVSKTGDINGDGYDDMFIGAVFGDRGLDADVGASYLLYGGPTLLASIDLALLGASGVKILGAGPGDSSGAAVSAADINADGFDDLIIGAPTADGLNNGRSNAGETYVIYGNATLPNLIDLNVATPGLTILGRDAGDESGSALAGVGDVNGDGYDDFMIGASNADGAGNAKVDSGESYLIFGGNALSATLDLAALQPAQGVRFLGVDEFDASGFAVGAAGDVNSDGYADVMIGAVYGDGPNNSVATTNAGEAYVVFGGPLLTAVPNATVNLATLGAAGVKVYGADANELGGNSVSGAGDVNGDGYDDFLVGAFLSDGPTNNEFAVGATNLIYGSQNLPQAITLADLSGADGVILYGEGIYESSGWSVSSAGDVNADGFDDLLIGATYPGEQPDPSFTAKGKTYIAYGAAALPSVIELAALATAGIEYVGADIEDTSGWSAHGVGDVNGDGFSDFMIGAPGADAVGNARLDAGESYLLYGGRQASAITHLGTAVADTLTGSAAENKINGGRGSDLLLGGGGADVLFGGEGSDVFGLNDMNFARITGGNGSDILRFDGADELLDLSQLANNRLRGIEQIDLTGSGDNTLILNKLELLNLSAESNTLLVRYNAGDTVEIGNGWTFAGTETIGEFSYQVLTQGAATLKLQIANQAPTAVVLTNVISVLAENMSTATHLKVADITIMDDGVGLNTLSLSGPQAGQFEIIGAALYIKAGTVLNFETLATYNLTVQVDDVSIGATPDAAAPYVLHLTNVNEPPVISLANVVATLPENANTATSIKLAEIVVTDDGPGGGILSLTGADAASFELFFAFDGPELQLKAGAELNYINKITYDVSVNIDDTALGNGIDSSVLYTLTLTQVNAPVVLTVDNALVSGFVLTTLTNTGTWYDREGGSVTLAASVGTVTMHANGTWSWAYAPGTVITSQQVTITGSDSVNVSTVVFNISAKAQVAGRKLFYNQSVFDGNAVSLSSGDDAAIASNKEALLPGNVATSLNYSNYSRGINGLVIDLAGATANVSVADFEFKVGNVQNPSLWNVFPVPQAFSVRPGEGSGGSTRVTIAFAEGVIRNAWLQVRVLPTLNTNLSEIDTFYWGHQVAETFNESAFTRVNAIDVSLIKANYSGFTPVPITSAYDIDKNGRVNAIDASIAQASFTGFQSLILLRAPST